MSTLPKWQDGLVIENSMIRIVLALALMSTSSLAAPLRDGPAVEFKDWRYELSTDQGGFLRGYDLKLREIEQSGFEIRVKDICASACTLVLRNPKACAERAALFGFHEARKVDAEKPGRREVSERSTKLMWSQYPEVVRAKVGQLTTEIVWIKGYELLPPCR